MEIERKFKLQTIPAVLPGMTGTKVLQGYLPTDHGELRVRRKGTQCFLTIKGEGSLAREEWESEIPEWVFEVLWPATTGRRIEKTRYELLYGGWMLEVDIYGGSLRGLIILECEFPNEAVGRGFVLPEWATDAVEVTADEAYKNKNLACK